MDLRDMSTTTSKGAGKKRKGYPVTELALPVLWLVIVRLPVPGSTRFRNVHKVVLRFGVHDINLGSKSHDIAYVIMQSD
jgi:hypothetical protein